MGFIIDRVNFRIVSLIFVTILIIIFSYKIYFSNLWNDDIGKNNHFMFLLYGLIIGFVFIITILFSVKIFRATSSVKNYRNYLTREECNKIMKETTELEKLKLFTNPKFIKMLKDKGSDESKWNWQLKARIEGNMNFISDDELDDISLSE
jgi:hypothetical protein